MKTVPFSESNSMAGKSSINVAISTMCKGCQCVVNCEWPREMSFGGVVVTPEEYMALTLRNDQTGVYCDHCLAKMPNVEAWNIFVTCPWCNSQDVARYKDGDGYKYVCQSCGNEG